MPLIIICGHPLAGKSSAAIRLKEYFVNKNVKCILVSDEDQYKLIDRNKLYSDSTKEKEVRGSLKADAIRHLNSETLVIFDSGNYIKGFRYELYCLSKEHKTTHCIVECSATPEEIKLRNCDALYDDKLIDALIARYEAPDSRNRWDSPHFLIHGEIIPLVDIDSALFSRVPPPPNLSTQSQPLADTNYMALLEKKTRDTINYISKAQQNGVVADMAIPDARVTLSLNKELTTAQLNRLRRQFLTYTKMHPVSSETQIVTTFVQYLNSNLVE
ncbi:Protein KTI12 -like protein [Halotydeus destructor]|nr:Protein KTI12 -like protein [Halotydeus destructor]